LLGIVFGEHTEEEHWYRYAPLDELYASVTTKTGIIDNPKLKRWAANLAVDYLDRNWDTVSRCEGKARADHYKAATLNHEDTLKDAGDIGTQGHAVIERYLKRWIETGERPADIRDFIEGTDARLWAIARSAEQFCVDFDVTPIVSEIKVANPRHKYAGTLDSLMIVRKEGKPYFCIVDFKTSNSIDKYEYAMQVAAYRAALVALTGLKPDLLLILQLDKEKMAYHVARVVDHAAAFRAFRHTAAVFDAMRGGGLAIRPFTPKKDVFFDSN